MKFDLSLVQKLYHEVILPSISPSPLRYSPWLSSVTGGDVWLKLESLNPNGSFKVRGALNAVFRLKNRWEAAGKKDFPLKVCAASAGNHAQGVAFAAKKLGCEAHIFLPRYAPLVKRDATKKLGAHLYISGDTLEDAFVEAKAFAKEQDAFFIHAFDNEDIILGQATCAYESFLQLAQAKNDSDFLPDAFLASVGGGGLLAGSALVGKTLSDKIQIIGVEQENYNSAVQSLDKKERIPASKSKTSIADGIAVGMIGDLNYECLLQHVDGVTTVSDDWIVKAILGLCEQERLVVEGAGAAAVADVLKRPLFYQGKTIVVCVSGGNIDPQLLMRVLTRGLNETGRVLRLSVCVADKPGGLKRLVDCVAGMEGNITDLVHDRTYSEFSVGDVSVELSLETRDFEHQYILIEKLEENGFKPRKMG